MVSFICAYFLRWPGLSESYWTFRANLQESGISATELKTRNSEMTTSSLSCQPEYTINLFSLSNEMLFCQTNYLVIDFTEGTIHVVLNFLTTKCSFLNQT